MASVAPPLSLLPLTDAEYHDFAERQVAESARQRVEAGEWTLTDAHHRVRVEQADLLADRLRGQGHTFLKGVHTADGTLVGWLWVGPGPTFLERYGVRDLTHARWLGQITVRDELRGRGYGLALLTALHEHLAAEGVEALYLRVDDWNTAARRLYARCGYEVVRQFSQPTPTCGSTSPRPADTLSLRRTHTGRSSVPWSGRAVAGEKDIDWQCPDLAPLCTRPRPYGADSDAPSIMTKHLHLQVPMLPSDTSPANCSVKASLSEHHAHPL